MPRKNAPKTKLKEPDQLAVSVADDHGEVWATRLLALEKHFATGSHGFHHGGKLTNPKTGKQYQLNLQFVEIGSKPKPTVAKKPAKKKAGRRA